MIAIGFVMFLGLLVVTAMVLVIMRRVITDYERTSDRLHQPGAETLVYDVPKGQDPVELTVALRQAGFTAVEDNEEGVRRVFVDCPHGRLADRATIRSVIEQVPVPAAGRRGGVGQVVFADER